MAVLIAAELGVLRFTINTLSSTRAFVASEGLWSKAQKNAVYYLNQFGHTWNDKDYNNYRSFLQVQEAGQIARMELEKNYPNIEIARESLLKAGNHPDDIDDMINLFGRFKSFSYMDEAIETWAKGDSLMAELRLYGSQLYTEVHAEKPSPVNIAYILSSIDVLNANLTIMEDKFSYTLGEGSRGLEKVIMGMLFIIVITVAGTGLFLTFLVSSSITRGVEEIISVAENVSKSDFSRSAKVFSGDEIGKIAVSFNNMISDLQKKIFELHESGEKLREQKEVYETLVTAQSEMGEGVLIAEGEKIIYTNCALCRMMGFSREELLSLPSFIPLLLQEEQSKVLRNIRLSQYDGIPRKDETTTLRKDGTRIIIEYSMKTMVSDKKVQHVVIIREITDQKKIAWQLQENARKLKESNTELEQFAYVASHDLREPLRTISSYVQLLQYRYKDKLDLEANDFIHFTVDGAKRMDRLINDLLAWSRVGRDREIKNIDLTETLEIVMMNLRDSVNETSATVTMGPLPKVQSSNMHMTQLFQNLVTNAIKFRGSKAPQISIIAEEKKDKWLFSVKDNGIGIDKKYADKIFVIFQRLHLRNEYEGTGIGLAICKKIVEQHGGQIWIESEVGNGSTFYFTLKK